MRKRIAVGAGLGVAYALLTPLLLAVGPLQSYAAAEYQYPAWYWLGTILIPLTWGDKIVKWLRAGVSGAALTASIAVSIALAALIGALIAYASAHPWRRAH